MVDGRALDLEQAQNAIFDACIPAIPYAAASPFLAREKHKLTRSDGDRPRVALSLPAIVEALAEGRYDLVHLCSPGPAGMGAWLLARVLELPIVGSYHTELAAYAGLRSGLPQLQLMASLALGAFCGSCDVVLSPSPASDERLAELGIAAATVAGWDRGVDLHRFSPQLRVEQALPGQVNVLYVGRLTSEKGVGLLAPAFLAARAQDPRLHLVLAVGGPEEAALRQQLNGTRHVPGLARR